VKEHFRKLTPEEQEEVLKSLPPEVLKSLPPEKRREVLRGLPPEERLAGLSAGQIRRYLDQLTADRPSRPRKPGRKK
jgi:hypothetical protein